MKQALVCWLFIGLSAIFSATYAQQQKNIGGLIKDSTGRAQLGASVSLTSGLESLTAATDEQGRFSFTGIKADSFRISVTSIGFKTFVKDYVVDKNKNSIELPDIILVEDFNALDQVVVTAIIPVRVKEDTVEFDARAYKVREGDAVEEMVKKLPGVEVDNDGKITTEGEPITRVRLNGKDFFGDDAAAALQNLPADIVKNLQIIDDYGEEAKITGVKSGEPVKILNINTEPDKENGYFVKGAAGLGTENRYVGRLRANDFRTNRKISFDGNLSNTARGDGLTNNRSAKVNYEGEWGDKINSYGTYQFSNRDNNVIETLARQDFYTDYTRYEDENRTRTGKNNQHRFSWNLEYKINERNYLKVQPNVSIGNSISNNSGLTHTRLLSSTSLRDYNTFSQSDNSDVGSRLYYNHKFTKRGRNFSINADINFSNGREDRDVSNEYTVMDTLSGSFHETQQQLWHSSNSSKRFRVEGSYMEPVGNHSFIELEYDWSQTLNESLRDVRDGKASPDSAYLAALSNHYNYRFITNRIELSYHYRHANLNYMFGVVAQPTLLKGRDISRNIATETNNFNLIPTARLSYKISKDRTLTASYRGRASQPGFMQLQPVTDNSNPQNTVIGNPDLKPEMNNRFEIKYNQSGKGSGYTIFSRINVQHTQNKIVTSRVIIPDSLKQQTTYRNANGFYTASGQYSISKPLGGRRFRVTYYGGGNFSRQIAFNNNEENIGRNFSLSQGLKLGIDIEDVVDAQLNLAYTADNTKYSLASFDDRRTSRVYMGLEGRNYFGDNWVLGYRFSQTVNNGFNTGNIDPTLLNMYVEYQFLKGNKARVRAQGFDLLNENTGITRDIFDNQIVDRQSNRLGRYFMLSFEFRLDKFGT